MITQIDSAVVGEERRLTQLAAIWQQIQHHLEVEKERIVEEIASYPPPIRACDAQFNGLLEERAAILEELWEVKGILKRSPTFDEHIELLNAFILSSRYLKGEIREELRQIMQG
jgi:hypothetical protein